LPANVAERARRVFERLAAAEGKVHGIAPERVHFHEVGAADAIVDIVGVCAGLAALGIDRVTCSPIATGSGTVECAHGTMPVPAPATAELLRGVPIAACDVTAELCTPTGAALLTTLAAEFAAVPPMRIDQIGYGAGTRDSASRANVLRVLVGEVAADDAVGDVVTVLETQLDDSTGQVIGHTLGRLLEAGALDAFVVPIAMKKDRPGQLLTVLSRPDDADRLEEILFRETTTFGVRRHMCERTTLERRHETVATPFGPIRVKVGVRGERVVQAWPEYDECVAAAREHGVSLREVQRGALRAWEHDGDARLEHG
jgi:uncharacterized protein (TIGR00299 family) protein